MGTFKQKRSRKSWDIPTLKLRVQDAIKSIEPVFLGVEGVDYDKEDMELKLKAAHAYSQLIGKAEKLAESEEIIERIQALEENRLSKAS